MAELFFRYYGPRAMDMNTKECWDTFFHFVQRDLNAMIAANRTVDGEVTEGMVLIPSKTAETDIEEFAKNPEEADVNGMYLYVYKYCRHPLKCLNPIPWRRYVNVARQSFPRFEYVYWLRGRDDDRLVVKRV